MNTLEQAMTTVSTWVNDGCTGSCEVTVDPIPDSTTWVDDVLDAISAKCGTTISTLSIQYHGGNHTFTITAEIR